MNKIIFTGFAWYLLGLFWILLVAYSVANAIFHPSMGTVISAFFNVYLLWAFGPRNK